MNARSCGHHTVRGIQLHLFGSSKNPLEARMVAIVEGPSYADHFLREVNRVNSVYVINE